MNNSSTVNQHSSASNAEAASKNAPNSSGYYNKLGDKVISCNNGVIGGMVAGSAGGVPGLTLGLIGGAIAGGCFEKGKGQGDNSVNNKR
ncbi:hypothetical protein [Sodalis sp. RH16]|uniref:hypothetical protein n=1 Tax=Sodalis sp. RH16 TaxID=3394331 RepID=UPI0039B675BD